MFQSLHLLANAIQQPLTVLWLPSDRYDTITIEEQRAWLQDHEKHGDPVWVAVGDDGGENENINEIGVLGYATYSQFRQRIGFRYTVENSVYVRPGMTGSGIGHKLMTHLIASARAAGKHCMVACVNASNEGSLTFHRRLGFQDCGTMKEVGYKFDSWLDMVILQLFL